MGYAVVAIVVLLGIFLISREWAKFVGWVRGGMRVVEKAKAISPQAMALGHPRAGELWTAATDFHLKWHPFVSRRERGFLADPEGVLADVLGSLGKPNPARALEEILAEVDRDVREVSHVRADLAAVDRIRTEIDSVMSRHHLRVMPTSAISKCVEAASENLEAALQWKQRPHPRQREAAELELSKCKKAERDIRKADWMGTRAPHIIEKCERSYRALQRTCGPWHAEVLERVGYELSYFKRAPKTADSWNRLVRLETGMRRLRSSISRKADIEKDRKLGKWLKAIGVRMDKHNKDYGIKRPVSEAHSG